ncbi:uncharacterized protein F4812DRAFT_431951 [Daldinia caldariorum]|uniref:uncharacterized protein n=1 Tax=Daldinia caldariorum TaxID=326644 RepID=UPI002008D722|nr:uncharacterized protein F4812DRAFT_431951 [Daldinia caldariorum]KAI1467270.1 hypothetical protein F4812DRAFT_431951 [Daldinia caldariorum]
MGASRVLRRFLPFSRTVTPLQAATYLLGIALFSISFLVFLNSAVSFVITDLLGVKTGVGDIVGTLGFVDEVVALVACPAWGLVSDRLGVRWVAVLGYGIIAVSLFCFVQARDVYPSLVIARIAFALGATAAATMVTAILPVLTNNEGAAVEDGVDGGNDDTVSVESEDSSRKSSHHQRDSVAMSLESDATITPEIFTQNLSRNRRGSGGSEYSSDTYCTTEEKGGRPSALAGYVGLFTGCGALVALALFLPLPARFSRKEGVTPAQAITQSFYVVGAVSLVVAVFVFFGLRGLHGEEGKGWRMLLGLRKQQQQDVDEPSGSSRCFASSLSRAAHNGPLPYHKLLISSLRLGATDPHIALGYLGGFVARASTVAISLFIPLYVNAFFIGNGYCRGSPNDPSPDLKKECRAAYVLASILTGVAQLAALLCAPLFGYASRKSNGINIPLVFASLLGVVGWIAFPRLQSPEYANVSNRGGSPAVFLVVMLVGISQIGAIVCSLGSLGRGVLAADVPIISNDDEEGNGVPHSNDDETDSLLGQDAGGSSGSDAGPRRMQRRALVSRVQLKGSIAGVYSWCGGVAILLLTKLGGYLFDVASPGAPFYMMAVFNGVLFVASTAIGVAVRRSGRSTSS